MGPLLFARMSEPEWADLLALLAVYRQLKRAVTQVRGSLW